VLAALAGGALGPGYLAAVGPSGWRVFLALAVELAVPAAITAALLPGLPGPAAARQPRAGDPRALKPRAAGRTGPDGGADRDESTGADGGGRTP